MKLKSLIYFVLVIALTVTGCEKDNYEPPTSMLKGQILYEGNPVGVRSNSVELELWQDGYDFFTKIPVMVAQDGSFSASLFDGDYKLVVRQGAPWVNNADSIDVQVRGEEIVEIPITPFFIITDETLTRSGDIVTGTFNIEEVAAGRAIDRISMYIGTTTILDSNFKEGWADIWGADVGDLNESKTLRINLADFNQAGREYIFARVGIQIVGIPEMIYTEVYKLE